MTVGGDCAQGMEESVNISLPARRKRQDDCGGSHGVDKLPRWSSTTVGQERQPPHVNLRSYRPWAWLVRLKPGKLALCRYAAVAG